MQEGGEDKVFDTILREEVRRSNQHLPRKRRPLGELLRDDSPEVSSIDGRKIVMRKAELEMLASFLPQDAIEKLQLPIVLIRRSDMGVGAFTVLSGDKLEMYAVAKLLGSFEGGLQDYRREVPDLVVYKPQISELIRKFHSLIVIGFGVPEGFRT